MDSEYPDMSAVATVQVPITRNVNSPRFTQETYEVAINENHDVGTPIIDVFATDLDNVRLWDINGDILIIYFIL